MHEDNSNTPGTSTTPVADMRNKIGLGLLAATFAFLIGAIAVALYQEERTLANPVDSKQVSRGSVVYAQHCAACHGTRLEGQPNWQERLPSGRMPAPPHDASGHTWHHPDSVLFGITKQGLVPGKYAPPKYESDMPAFSDRLSDEEIWAVLAYVKSTWPEAAWRWQADVNRNVTQR